MAQEMVPPCELTVTATHADFAQGKAVREIAPAATSPVRIEVSLRVPARIAGFVLGETGQPIEGVWVSVQPDGETIGTERVTTDADGYFLFASLPEGPFTLRARASGRRSYEEHFPAAREDLVVRLPPFDQATAELRAQLTAKIAEVYERLQSATNDKECKAISAELQALGAELQALGSPSSEADR